MDEEEQEWAEKIQTAIHESSRNSDRAEQDKQYILGVSSLGYCSEKVRRFLDRQVPEPTDMTKAFIGTWLGEGVEQAVKKQYPDCIIQGEVTLNLTGDSGNYSLPGHFDIVFPAEGVLLDTKTGYGLELARRSGADQQKNFQRHCYALAAWKQGLFAVPLEEVKVGNIWMDRSGRESDLHVELEPFDMAVVEEAALWLDDVVYAFKHDQEARKEPAREVCAATCGFFKVCRAYDTDVEGLLTDPTVLTAVQMDREGAALEKRGKLLRDEAKVALDGVTGSTGEWLVRWTHVNASSYEVNRKAYDKLSIAPLKKEKKK